MGETKKIAILCSGGDAPGYNAAVIGATKAAESLGYEVIGFVRGFDGLYNNKYIPLKTAEIESHLREGGSYLHSARFQPFNNETTRQPAIERCVENANALGLEGLIVIGGDGSFAGARDLIYCGTKNDPSQGIHCICIPGTIDNDIACTDYTIGFDTALNTVVELCDKLADTDRAHDRCMIAEVMGNLAGDLPLYASIASNATDVLIGETFTEADVTTAAGRVKQAYLRGQRYFLILVAEGITFKIQKDGSIIYPGPTLDSRDHHGIERIAKEIQKATQDVTPNGEGIECRYVQFGHVQRGGRPTAKDRITGMQMGALAAQLLMDGQYNLVTIIKNGLLTTCTYEECLAAKELQKLRRADPDPAARVKPELIDDILLATEGHYPEYLVRRS
ncbi:MAG: ATP-dependent 6-phosphofructokinase [Oscillospiraceae bacterium]|nr:ATP-dependent 6-phosphofructokinase [Oscillospiraceae bacterium]